VASDDNSHRKLRAKQSPGEGGGRVATSGKLRGMKHLLLTTLFCAIHVSGAWSQPCVEASRPQPPVLSEKTRAAYEANLADARDEYDKNPKSADAIIWLGRRTAYLGNYKAAIKIFGDGLALYPGDARFYRHRGHRFITLRCFDDAIRDFAFAAKLIRGKPDEVEPDGIPNERNTPTSTLQSNIWYHLGLAYYLKGDLKSAANAYVQAFKVSKNNDMLAATTHWYYMTLRRLEKNAQAQHILEPIDGDFEVIENEDYLRLLRLYRGEVKPEMILAFMEEGAGTLSNASLGYGIGNWFLYNRDRSRAFDIFRRIVAGNQWASFGYIAAEAELGRG
jgi:tetratricopeptide (TPR) repeat protein